MGKSKVFSKKKNQQYLRNLIENEKTESDIRQRKWYQRQFNVLPFDMKFEIRNHAIKQNKLLISQLLTRFLLKKINSIEKKTKYIARKLFYVLRHKE